MQFSTLFVTLLATAVMANPVKRTTAGSDTGYPTPYDACSGLYDSLQCCATDVLGIADLDCGTPSGVPTSPASFAAICASGGQRARCCVLPILGQSVLCQTPLGL
ncbi:fungal hydrophobin [Xylaria sp. FL1777]|nr:fungal hydrophobin [Xylaria sp. FL1777]